MPKIKFLYILEGLEMEKIDICENLRKVDGPISILRPPPPKKEKKIGQNYNQLIQKKNI
jgi:hypothetical protein